MEYFIGYELQGDAAEWHIRVAREIFEKFNNYKIHDKIPPHITIFRPFNTEDIGSIKSLLLEWT
ncbi:MAG: hypothetical protein Q8P21_02620, partial [bacterium]|nr:hypothetical protein [bacterium]